jgi:hypothetical protein
MIILLLPIMAVKSIVESSVVGWVVLCLGVVSLAWGVVNAKNK